MQLSNNGRHCAHGTNTNPSSPRHGWGCKPDAKKAVSFLSAAASNAAEIEQMALAAGLKKGGAAKGELVLAIFELANCFRHGWGIPKDPIAAKQVGSNHFVPLAILLPGTGIRHKLLPISNLLYVAVLRDGGKSRRHWYALRASFCPLLATYLRLCRRFPY